MNDAPPPLTRGERLVLIALSGLADSQGYAAPAPKALALRAGYGVRQAVILLSNLVAKGYLEKAGTGRELDCKGVSFRTTTRYRLVGWADGMRWR